VKNKGVLTNYAFFSPSKTLYIYKRKKKIMVAINALVKKKRVI